MPADLLAMGMLGTNLSLLFYFQGLFIFIMHILRNPLVVRALRARYKKYKLGRKDPLSDFSSGHTTTAQHGKRRTDKTISSVQVGLTRTRYVSMIELFVHDHSRTKISLCYE